MHTESKQTTNWLLFIGIILIAANLRAPLTSVGALIEVIRDDLGMSNTLAGAITTVPLLAFAFLSPFAPKIANRIGMERTILFALIFLFIGILLRSFFGISLLFIGTVLIGLGIAVGNVLLPGFIKMNFPLRIGIMTGLYAVFMNLFGAFASGVSVPLAAIKGVKWEGSLALWALLALLAILFWIPQLRSSREAHQVKKSTGNSIWRSRLAWYITLFMGLQSLMFYTLITWLPVILKGYGYSSSGAGWMLFLMQFVLIPVTFIVPIIAEKMPNQKLLSALVGVCFFIGILGIMTGIQALIIIAVILIGSAIGSAFSLAMMFFSLRTSSGQEAAEMSGMAQSFGYLLAAFGPILFGVLYDVTSSWQLPLVILLILSVAILIVGVLAGKKRVIGGV